MENLCGTKRLEFNEFSLWYENLPHIHIEIDLNKLTVNMSATANIDIAAARKVQKLLDIGINTCRLVQEFNLSSAVSYISQFIK